MPHAASIQNGRRLIFLAVGASLVLGLGLSPAYDLPIDAYGYGLRVTARTSFVFFMLAYFARPLQEVFGVGGWLVRHRRYLGLAAAFSHTVHFGYIVLYNQVSAEPIDILTLVFGGGAFVVLWLMALTSNDRSVRLLGRWWKRMHRFGLHYVWAVFVFTFSGVALVHPWYWSFVAAGIAGLGLRVAARGRARNEPSARNPG